MGGHLFQDVFVSLSSCHQWVMVIEELFPFLFILFFFAQIIHVMNICHHIKRSLFFPLSSSDKRLILTVSQIWKPLLLTPYLRLGALIFKERKLRLCG